MTKTEFIKYIEELPDNLDIYMTEEDLNNCIDIKIFTEKKNEKFYNCYFGM